MPKEKLPKPPKVNNKKSSGKTFFTIFFLVIVIFLFVRVRSISPLSSIGGRDSLQSEISAIRDAIEAYGNDMNEMRDYLLLPKKEYQFFQDEGDVLKLAEGSDPALAEALIRFASETATQTEKEEKWAQAKTGYLDAIAKPEFKTALQELGLISSFKPEELETKWTLKIWNGKTMLLEWILDKEKLQQALVSVQGVQPLTSSDSVINLVKNQKDSILSLISKIEQAKMETGKILANPEISKALVDKKMTLKNEPVESEKGWEYTVRNGDDSPIFTFILNRNAALELGGESYTSGDVFTPALLKELEKLNSETEAMKLVREKKESIEFLLYGKEFQASLEKAGLELKKHEEGDRLYFDLTRKVDQKNLASFILETKTGAVFFSRNGEEFSTEEILDGSKKNF